MKITVNSYDDLRTYVKLFKQGTLEILIVEGYPGVGKTSLIKEVFKDTSSLDICYLDGRVSAPIFYEKLYQYRDCHIILDDCDSLYKDKQSLELLKSLCNTSEKDKRVSWNIKRKLTLSSNSDVELPYSFFTGSTVCIICNQWKSSNMHTSSIEDRGILISFQPSFQMIHAYAKNFIQDKTVVEFIGKYLYLAQNISLRLYKIAEDIKKSQDTSIDKTSEVRASTTHYLHGSTYATQMHQWQVIILQSIGLNQEDILCIQLHEDTRINAVSEKAQIYSEILGKSPRSYWRSSRELFPR